MRIEAEDILASRVFDDETDDGDESGDNGSGNGREPEKNNRE